MLIGMYIYLIFIQAEIHLYLDKQINCFDVSNLISHGLCQTKCALYNTTLIFT